MEVQIETRPSANKVDRLEIDQQVARGSGKPRDKNSGPPNSTRVGQFKGQTCDPGGSVRVTVRLRTLEDYGKGDLFGLAHRVCTTNYYLPDLEGGEVKLRGRWAQFLYIQANCF